MSAAINSSTVSNPPRIFLGISITDARVKKIAGTFFAAVCFFVGCSLLSYGWLIKPLSVPFFILFWLTANAVFRLKDYGTPEMLEAYRLKAKKQTLEEIISEHGLLPALKFKIFPPAVLQQNSFKEKLTPFLDLLTPKGIAHLRAIIYGALCPPDPDYFHYVDEIFADWIKLTFVVQLIPILEKLNESELDDYRAKLLDQMPREHPYYPHDLERLFNDYVDQRHANTQTN